MTDKKTSKAFALLIDSCQEPPESEVQCAGHLFNEFFKTVVDEGTEVDRGAGFSEYDLWGVVGGKELFVTIQLSKRQKAIDAAKGST